MAEITNLDICPICGEPIEDSRARQDEDETIICEDCFMAKLTTALGDK